MNKYQYKVVSIDKVVDGDTFYLTIDIGFDLLKKVKLRLKDVNTPEIRKTDVEGEKEAGLEAKAWAESLLRIWMRPSDGGFVALESHEYKRGKFGRLLGDIISHQIHRKDRDDTVTASLSIAMRIWCADRWPQSNEKYGHKPWKGGR